MAWYKLFLACLMAINDLLLLLKNIGFEKRQEKDGSPSPYNCCFIYYIEMFRQKFLVWLCEEISNNKHGWTPVKYLNVLHQNRTQKYCNTLCKNITNFLFRVLWTYLATSIKSNYPNLRKLWWNLMFICMQKMNSLTSFFWDILKILETYYFEYFKNAWPNPAVMTVSPCRHHWYPKCWNQPVGNFDVHLQAKNALPS